MQVKCGLKIKIPVVRYGSIDFTIEFEDGVQPNETPEQAYARLMKLCHTCIQQQLNEAVSKYLEVNNAAQQITGGAQ